MTDKQRYLSKYALRKIIIEQNISPSFTINHSTKKGMKIINNCFIIFSNALYKIPTINLPCPEFNNRPA